MTRTAFERKLSGPEEDLLVMANLVETAIVRSIDALKNRDVDLAHRIVADDVRINERRYAIEENCLELMATQQPLAGTSSSSWTAENNLVAPCLDHS